jgi:hypothetical protein
MSEAAANIVYYRIAEHQKKILSSNMLSHAETRAFALDDGRVVHLILQEVDAFTEVSDFPVSAIEGVSFNTHQSISTGEESFIIPVQGPSPLYIVDHGSHRYDFDSFGVHLGQEDHLTFLARSGHRVRLKLVDMRAGSDTLHLEEWHEFECNPRLELVIPCGVAHALFNMADVFTLNRPLLFLDPLRTYQPGRDIIDWPLSDTHYPIFNVLKLPASVPYYEALVEQQKIMMATPVDRETPTSFLFDDPATGKRVKVMLTKPVDPGPSDIRS